MKKQEIYVPIANKKEAKRAKAVLEAMGEKCGETLFYRPIVSETGGLYFNTKNKHWTLAHDFGSYKLTKTTLKQLIELLVVEQTEPEKIAVRVDNEKEFNALMKYYDSLGWKWASGDSPVEIKYNSHIHSVRFEIFFGHASGNFHEIEDYKIIPFSEFAKEHGIRVPLLVSEDCVELFEGDKHFFAARSINGEWKLNPTECILLPFPKTIPESYNNPEEFIQNSGEYKAFSTRQSAIDWIEAQKPKTIEHTLYFGGIASVNADKSEIEIGSIKLCFGDIHDLHTIITARKS